MAGKIANVVNLHVCGCSCYLPCFGVLEVVDIVHVISRHVNSSVHVIYTGLPLADNFGPGTACLQCMLCVLSAPDMC